MSRFSEASIIERRMLEDMFIEGGVEEYGFTDEDSFEQYDGKYIYEGKKVIFEVKVRNIDSGKYKTTIIEESKYRFLLDYCKENPDVHPYIFIFFTDNKVFRGDLREERVNFVTKMAPKTTMGDNTKVKKKFVEIKIDKSKLYIR